jgi:hypothetical protein
MRYFYTDTNRQPQGPESREKILELLNRGVINSAALVAEEGGKTWLPISSLSAGASPSAPPLPDRFTEPLAILSLTLSALSFVCCYFGFASAIAGIVLGHLARGKIRKNPDLNGDGLALAGLIIGYVAVTLQLLYLVFVILGFAGLSAQSLIRHL